MKRGNFKIKSSEMTVGVLEAKNQRAAQDRREDGRGYRG